MRTITITLGLFCCLSAFTQKGEESVCQWNSNGNEELNVPLESYQYFRKGMLYHYLSNDKENIYLDIKVTESEAQSKILKEGMTVWINIDDKQTKKNGIRFPLGTENSGGPGRQHAMNIQGSLLSPVEQANTIQLIGFGGTFKFIPANNTDGFRGSVHYNNDGVLIYRLIIPVARLNAEGEVITGPFAIGIEPGPYIPDFSQMQRPGGSSGDMTRPMGGGGGRGTGGMRGGPGGGGSGGRGQGGPPSGRQMPASMPQAQAKNAILWIKKISLASEK
jgi:hypothetical protein